MNQAIGTVAFILLAAAYFAPAIVALSRHVPNTGSVVIVDLLLGWTVIGWIVAMAMAVRSKPAAAAPPPVMPQQGQYGRRRSL